MKEIEFFLDIGKALLEAGAEVHRVEDTMCHLCAAYKMTDVQSFAIRSLILLRARDTSGAMQSGFRRIYSIGIDMGRLEDLNQFSRDICTQIPDPKTIREKLNLIIQKQAPKKGLVFFAYLLAPFAFTFFYGSTSFVSAVFAAILGGILYFLDQSLARRLHQRVFYTIVVSAILGTISIFLGKTLPFLFIDKVMISVIMLLVPGMALMNSARDMIDNNPMNGVFSCLDAILTAGAIAVGFAIPMLLL